MTVHSAKGLEAPNVFIPFCHWSLEKDKANDYLWCQAKGLRKEAVEPLKMIPLRLKKDLKESEYEPEITAEHEAQHIDNINALYVAFTRARDNLYIYGAYQLSDLDNSKTVAALLHEMFRDRWTEQDKTDFLALESVSTTKKNATIGRMHDRFSFTDATVPYRLS